MAPRPEAGGTHLGERDIPRSRSIIGEGGEFANGWTHAYARHLDGSSPARGPSGFPGRDAPGITRTGDRGRPPTRGPRRVTGGRRGEEALTGKRWTQSHRDQTGPKRPQTDAEKSNANELSSSSPIVSLPPRSRTRLRHAATKPIRREIVHVMPGLLDCVRELASTR